MERSDGNVIWVDNGDVDVLGYSKVAAFPRRYGGWGEEDPVIEDDASYFIHFRSEAFKLTQVRVYIDGTLYELCYDGVRKLSIKLRE